MLAGTLASALPASAALLPAGSARRGATYSGTTGHGHVPMTLKVSSSGRSLMAGARYAPLYCHGSAGMEHAFTKPAAIDGGGYFRATISYEYVPRHTVTAQLLLSGRFFGAMVRGTARSIFPRSQSCSGATVFSAAAR